MTTAVRRIAVVTSLVLLGVAGAAAQEVVASVPNPSEGYQARPVIEIWKSERKMELRSGDQVVRQFRVALGQQPRYGKERQGDSRTPVGQYYVAERKTETKFHRFLGLSYPNVEDAERGYRHRLIDANQWADIFFANLRGAPPPWYTSLGGRVGIHGYGGRPYIPVDWTEGCIAVSDDEIEFIFDRVSVGTPVIINE